MKKSFWILLCLLIPACAFSQIRFKRSQDNINIDYANPKQYEIGGITVSGAKFLDPAALISVSGLKVGDKITVPGEDISKAIHKLWGQGILGDIEIGITKIEGDYIFLDFYLIERPRLSKFTFNGIKKTQAEDLREKISLIRGKVVTDALISSTESTIKKYFLDKGYLNVKIDIKQQNDSLLANSVILNIDIDRGSKVKIDHITFSGNEAIADKKLRRQMKDTKEKKFYKIFTTSKFNRESFENDKQLIIDYYNSEGYRDAVIVSDSVYQVEEDRLGINLTVDEGQKYYFRNITWSGNYLYDDELLSKIFGIKSGSTYDKENLEKRLHYNPTGMDITSLYMNDGYLFFNIEPTEILVEGDSIDIEMRIYEGPQATIRDVNIAGNSKTSDHVVLRELRTVPGQKFSREDLIRSQRELSNLGYFDPEQIGINPIPNQADGTVDINYTVVERPNDQITLSGGWGGPYGLVGTVGLVLNNFSLKNVTRPEKWKPIPAGDGQRLALNIQANGLRYQSYSFSFTEPWLGGRKPNSFSVSLTKVVSRNTIGDVSIGHLKINGGSVSLGRRLTWPDDYFTLSHSLSYYNYNIKDYAVFENFSTGSSNSVALVNTFARNSINSPIYPVRGSSVSLTASLTPPYSIFNDIDYATATPEEKFKWIEYHKWMFDASWFVKLAGNLVLNTRTHYGFIGTYSPELEQGPFERFRVGGSGLGAGNFLVGTDYIGLRGYDDESVITAPSSERGGVAFNKYVLELRHPVTLNPSATVFGLVFAEAGNNFGSVKAFDPMNLRRSVGIGARVFMPAFGLLGFDYGYGFDNAPGAKKGHFHFMIGQQLR